MRFIDLFAGLGGFHVALSDLGHECVFASEINQPLQELYQKNFGIEVAGDIKQIIKAWKRETTKAKRSAKVNKPAKKKRLAIPSHDILCAGFPCQPFSKAGNQAGLDDETRGTLFDDIVEILKEKQPKYFILENVPHLAKHDDEQTLQNMLKKLKRAPLNYTVDYRNYSPHEFGIPQHRERIFIVGSKTGLDNFEWPAPTFEGETDIRNFIEPNPQNFTPVHADELACLDLWQEFLELIPPNDRLPGFPIWAMESGANYPFEQGCPDRMTAVELGRYTGMFGRPLAGLPKREQMKLLPSYARTEKVFPEWKKRYIRQNREFFTRYENILGNFINRLSQYESQSWQKLEWNVQGGERNIRNYIIQFRASGIRLKKPNFFPSLVCTNTQIPIIGWEERYITRHEGARLQSLESLTYLPENDNSCFKALGNAVNAEIIRQIASKLIRTRARAEINQPDTAELQLT